MLQTVNITFQYDDAYTAESKELAHKRFSKEVFKVRNNIWPELDPFKNGTFKGARKAYTPPPADAKAIEYHTKNYGVPPSDASEAIKSQEYTRLKQMCIDKGWALTWAKNKYIGLYGTPPAAA